MMTSIDTGQLSSECSLWRDQLRAFRNKLFNYQSILSKSALHRSDQAGLIQLEHLHNQLHIQQINIHDLKQEVKRHLQKISFELTSRHKVSDGTIAKHEVLQEEYQILTNTLRNVSNEFESFYF
jgi:hypothetical protein